MAGKYRTIAQERRFTEQLTGLSPDPRNANDFVSGVEWILARDPRKGTRVAQEDGLEIWAIPFDESAPELWVFYSFTDEDVTLYRIELIPAQD